MKVLKLVASCADCPRASYYSGGVYRCTEADVNLPESARSERIIPAWCPLTEYPAAAMNELARQVRSLEAMLQASRDEVSALRRRRKAPATVGG